ALIAVMKQAPWGPAYVELTGENARRIVDDADGDQPIPDEGVTSLELKPALELLARCKKPVILVGLEARAPGIGGLIGALARRLGAPILSTYKAKGIVPDTDPNAVGLFTGGAAERDCVGQADLIVLCGFDPVELIGRPWAYASPVLDLGAVDHPVH